MKSILQEASTIAKAVEQGWKEAGEPSEFSIKILELPQRNFIGITTRSAKIAFIFNGVAHKNQESAKGTPVRTHVREKKDFVQQATTQRQSTSFGSEKKQFEKRAPEESSSSKHVFEKPASDVARSVAQQKPTRETFSVHQETESPVARENVVQRKHTEGLWNDEVVAFSRDWLSKVFMYMERPDITFTIEPQSFYLRITLSAPVFGNEGQEKHLLASLSSLMFATIKKHFRKALRGHKIVLTHNKS